jgi:hypothetical protein
MEREETKQKIQNISPKIQTGYWHNNDALYPENPLYGLYVEEEPPAKKIELTKWQKEETTET